MPNPNSVVRKAHFRERQLPVVADVIKAYKKAGYKVQDGIESVLIVEPNSTFRVFISRISHVLQFYYLGEPQSVQEFSTKDLESAGHIIEEEGKYKEMFG
jgi:hypothetical protein